jgi:hypothetical protein
MEKGRLLLLVLAVLPFWGCRDNEQYCVDARAELAGHTFTGLLRVCNAEPPNDTSLASTATVTSVTEDALTLRLVAGTLLDTTQTYVISCDVVEKTIPIIFIHHPASEDDGQYNQGPDRIGFPLEFGNCSGLAWFEGQ